MGFDFNSFLFEDKIVKQIVWESIDSMFEELKSLDVPNSSIVKEQWYNIYTKDSQDQYQEIHHHLSEYPVIHNDIRIFSIIFFDICSSESNRKESNCFPFSGPHTGRPAY